MGRKGEKNTKLFVWRYRHHIRSINIPQKEKYIS